MISTERRNWGLAPLLAAAAALCALLVLAVHNATGLGGSGADSIVGDWLYDALLAAAGVSCLLRAQRVEAERGAWLAMGAGLLAWTAGEVYYTLAFGDSGDVPIPSPADIGYLAFYPASYTALVLLARARVPHFPRSLWLDGTIAATAVAALAATLAFKPIVDSSVGVAPTAVATNLAYPIGDLLLLSMVVAVFGLSGWRPGRGWALLGAGLAAMAVADGAYLLESARGTYTAGGMLDVWWPAAALLVGFAAWAPTARSDGDRLEGMRLVVVPAACGMLALGLVAAQHDPRDTGGTLALITLFLVTLRMAAAFRANQRMLAESRQEALTDTLTGLGNRRSLMADLDRTVATATLTAPRLAVMFDLDGFKGYNDSYGHPAGDELLRRLGRRLDAAVRPFGAAYRLGGDEFCVLAAPGEAGAPSIVQAAAAALSEAGEGFVITASHGSVMLPAEGATVSAALLLADQRMYAHKGSGQRDSAARQTRDVLVTTLRESQPDLHDHLSDVANLAVLVGRELGMEVEQLDEVRRAAELHDVGKVAIPDAILNKPGPLDDQEWEFMRRHTLIGERIVAAAPALSPVATLVRSSHERWDGAGYPDGLEGDDAPLGARVVAACDAFDAMVTDRPYRDAMSYEEAMAELRRCAGAQFDPRVIDAFERVYAPRPVGD